MKKLVLILVCAVLLIFFVGFNYLLWDREKNTKSIENLEYSNENKDATIDALGRDIKNLEDYNRQLTTKLDIVEGTGKDLEEKTRSLEQKILDLENRIKQKNDVINVLKQNMDITPFQDIVKKWADSIGQGSYHDAYRLMAANMSGIEPLSLDAFAAAYKDNIKSMILQSVELSTENIPEGKKGDIIFTVTLDIEKIKDDSTFMFDEGSNKCLFTLIYDENQSNWMIADISVVH